MNNLGFNKNVFVTQQSTKIASKVVMNNNAGRVSVDEIRANMNNIGKNINAQPDNSLQKTQIEKNELEQMRLRALKNIGRKC